MSADDTQPVEKTPVETTQTPTAVLRRDARFSTLRRPDHDLDRGGIRPGAAPTLSTAGGILLFAAAFGAWLRVTRLAASEAELEIAHEVLGRDLTGGFLLVVLGLGALAASAAWFRSSRRLRQAAHAVVLGGAGTVAVLLVSLQQRITDTTVAAIDQAGFFDLNVGAGWGAWAGLVGAGALALSSAFAALVGPPDPESDDGVAP